jgi:membrane associated rhomboid family serine protease
MITTIILIATVAISLLALRNYKLQEDYIFNPTAITYNNQWYRFITCGFVHANEMHLAFNMISFYMFGNMLEDFFDSQLFLNNGKFLYLLLYISSLFFCLVPTYIKQKHNYNYRSLGASGAVSAIVFACIFLNPLQGIGLLFIPGIYFPAFIFGFVYLAITAYLAKKGSTYINHSAHLWGSIYGILFTAMVVYLFTKANPFAMFIDQVINYFK